MEFSFSTDNLSLLNPTHDKSPPQLNTLRVYSRLIHQMTRFDYGDDIGNCGGDYYIGVAIYHVEQMLDNIKNKKVINTTNHNQDKQSSKDEEIFRFGIIKWVDIMLTKPSNRQQSK
ncbi:hypothetical protein DFA_10400 [Cavenderia fasciculata]|uniref:Uncharacterized protein n=1 Tax=Cavenderia fasciculata TaxID=261658 RepID=F4QA39_CACFS|nr:uncharacterized protein DFA_10400 [Cavenderia fasciculata]EGG15558.1 hypothetical protein DFA_10400 [Cavenderia fasciculata]|eukprot:XP_004354300.1 hypothetical protein DFA_10400 [Cavenderia fasciculata]